MTEIRPIMLRGPMVDQIRKGQRTHMCLPSTFVPGRRLAVSQEARDHAVRASFGTMALPTAWTKLRAGDMLWVQEEAAALIDRRDPAGSRRFFKLDLHGGHVPIPGGAKGGRYETVTYDASKLEREDSRYTLAIAGVRVFRAWDITWDEIRAEGSFDAHQTMGAWWEYRYAFVLGSWKENPEVCGLSFRFVDGNVDTGERWVPDPPPANSARTAQYLRELDQRRRGGEGLE